RAADLPGAWPGLAVRGGHCEARRSADARRRAQEQSRPPVRRRGQVHRGPALLAAPRAVLLAPDEADQRPRPRGTGGPADAAADESEGVQIARRLEPGPTR